MDKNGVSPAIVAVVVILVVVAGVGAYFFIAGQNASPSQPVGSISPANPQESNFENQYSTFKLTAAASATDPDGDPITYSYQWLKNGEVIEGATTNELPAALMGQQGHTVRGYEFKCRVTASDDQGNQSTGDVAVTMGGPSLGAEKRGGRFSNFFRVIALNEAANPSIAVMKEHINCNWISICFAYFQDNIDATTIYEKVITDQSEVSTIAESDLISQIRYAHNIGLEVMLYPEICISGQGWPGSRDQISGSPEWFAAYQAKIVHLAEIAQAENVGSLCIGVELSQTQDKENSWRQLIQAVRARYSGPLVYSAMYYADIFNVINWWDALDYIGVTCLFEIPTGGTDMTLTDLVSWYSGYREVIHNASTQFNRPVIVTETSAFSLDGCTKWGCPVTEHSNTQDWQEQADYFGAVFETFADQPWVVGLFVEDWVPTEEQWYQQTSTWATNTSFLNKPAERVIQSWFTQ